MEWINYLSCLVAAGTFVFAFLIWNQLQKKSVTKQNPAYPKQNFFSLKAMPDPTTHNDAKNMVDNYLASPMYEVLSLAGIEPLKSAHFGGSTLADLTALYNAGNIDGIRCYLVYDNNCYKMMLVGTKDFANYFEQTDHSTKDRSLQDYSEPCPPYKDYNNKVEDFNL